jgi:hypothetical protein
VGGALGPVAVVKGAGPKGMGDGAGGPLHEGLSEEGGAGPSPVDPVFVAASLGDGRDAHAFLHRGRVAKRSRRSPKAANSREENTGPAPGR